MTQRPLPFDELYASARSRGACPNCKAGSMRDATREERHRLAVVTARCDACGFRMPRLEPLRKGA